MTDKQRIERLLQTLMILKNCLEIIKRTHQGEQLHVDIEKVKRMIESVIQRNAYEITLDL